MIEFSVLVPVWNPEPEHLVEAVASVVGQTYPRWELLLVADGPQKPEVESVLELLAERDERIRLLRTERNVGISGASQLGLESARHEFVALLDHDDRFSIHALGAFAAEFEPFDDVDMAYSDEDKLDSETGARTKPFYKPSFSMERLRCQMYIGHLLVLRRDLALEVGGFRSDFDGAQDHDLALRMAERSRRVLHLPRLLYHWRQSEESTALNPESKSWAWEAGRRAVADHLTRTGFPATAGPSERARGVTKLTARLEDPPPVSIIIPTGNARRTISGVDTVLAHNAIRSVLTQSTYPDYELVIVADAASTEAELDELRELVGGGRHQVVHDRREFNFSAACNLGAVRAAGRVLVFLNDDTEVREEGWLEQMVMYAIQPDIGAVGLKLLYANGLIQHAGVWTRGEGPGHRYMGFPGDHRGAFDALNVPHNCVAVTAACLAVERTKFDEVGGFCLDFPLAFNDVDFCFKLLHRGYRNVVDCTTTLVHHESATRDPAVREWEVRLLERRWKPLLDNDPFDNPCNLAIGVNEYPPSPIGVVERMIHDDGVIDVSARGWPSGDPYHFGVRR